MKRKVYLLLWKTLLRQLTSENVGCIWENSIYIKSLVLTTVLWLCKRLPLFLENMEILHIELKRHDKYTYTYIHPYTHIHTFKNFSLKRFRKIIGRRDDSKANVAKWFKKKTFGMNDIVIIFVVSQVLACVKTLPKITLNMCRVSTTISKYKI